MNAEELVQSVLIEIWPEQREQKRTKEIWSFRRSRYADGVLVAAAELIREGRTGASAEALFTAALERAGIKRTQFSSLAVWSQERVQRALEQMLAAQSKPATPNPPVPKRGKTRTIAYDGRTFTVTGKGTVIADGGRCSVYAVSCGDVEHEDIVVPFGRATVDHLEMTGVPKVKEPPPARRGRPPKGHRAMTGAERQRALQERRRWAEAGLRTAYEFFEEIAAIIQSDMSDQAQLEKIGRRAAFLRGYLARDLNKALP